MSESSEGSEWVVAPGPDTALISIDVSEAAELTPEVRMAVETLARALEEAPRAGEPDEVEGFMKCPTYTVCTVTSYPCIARTIVDCVVKTCPSACPKASLCGAYIA